MTTKKLIISVVLFVPIIFGLSCKSSSTGGDHDSISIDSVKSKPNVKQNSAVLESNQ